MGVNVIINYAILAANSWETVPGIPAGVKAWSMQARGDTAFLYRWLNQTNYWTVKAGQVRSGTAPFPQGRLQVYSANVDEVIEIECATAVRA